MRIDPRFRVVFFIAVLLLVAPAVSIGQVLGVSTTAHPSAVAVSEPLNGPFTRYLAEGATSDFLDTRLALLNTNALPTTATLTFSRVGSTPVVTQVVVPGRTRITVEPKAIAGLASAEFSTKVESDYPLIVDRLMSWDATGYGAHAETAIAAPSPIWYLAEGATHSGFDLFYLLQNPGSTETTVKVRYLRPSGVPLEKNYVLPPNSRTNIWVNNETFPLLGTALASTDVSAVLESLDDTPFIVERALYLSSQGRVFNAGHESAGVTAPATQWFLAEGATGQYFDLFVLIANPNNQAADVRITYLLTTGQTYTRTLTAPPNSRSNVWVDVEQFPGIAGFPLADVAVSTTVVSENSVPVIVERSLWWPGDFATWHEAHNSAGATRTGVSWALAEGEVGGPRGTETYILIANASPFPGLGRVTLFFEDGSFAERTYTLPANSRSNVAIGPDFGAVALDKRFGSVVESIGNTPAQIVVEQAMYWNAGGATWAAGTNALATRLDEADEVSLAVSVGAGASGSPSSTTAYTRGATVNYSYSLQAGYQNLVVRLDGQAVPSSGSLTMGLGHSLSATATPPAPITYSLTVTKAVGVAGAPSASGTYTEGTSVSYGFSLQAGYQNLVVMLDGVAAPASGSVSMGANHTLSASATPIAVSHMLTVSLGAGATGSPGASGSYAQGTTVNYSYALQSGYQGLLVTLDGAPVAASGTVTMGSSHTLAVSASPIAVTYSLTVSIGAGTTGSPGTTGSHAQGTTVNYSYALQPGYQGLVVRVDGVSVAASGTVTMNGNHAIAVSATPTSAPLIPAFSATPEFISAGGSSTLAWTTSGATSCSLNQGIGTVPCNSGGTVTPASTTTYVLSANGPGGTTTASVTVFVSVPSPTYYLWGGSNEQTFLGVLRCINCVEYTSDSINNRYGNYGSDYSSTSIWNDYSQYGSAYSTYSSCNSYASNPPALYDVTGTVRYGELTLNTYRATAIRDAGIVSWLRSTVCP